ncbi:hypothetical protein NHQ30_001473 [Ciborinia camelliae]|nr:hypothetical protein NHQ30_001473 [Ciborinia camelliae]
METVNHLAAAASKVIWGESQSPQSQSQGQSQSQSQAQATADAANATFVPETGVAGSGTEATGREAKGTDMDMKGMDMDMKGVDMDVKGGVVGNTKKGDPYDMANSDSASTEPTNPNPTTADPSITATSSGLGAKAIDSPHPSTTTTSNLPAKTIRETQIAPLAPGNDNTNTNTSTTDSSSNFKTTPENLLISENINPNLPSTTDTSTHTHTSTEPPATQQTNPQPSTTLPIHPIHPEHQTEKTGVTDLHRANSPLGTQSRVIKPSLSRDDGAPEMVADKNENEDKDGGVDLNEPDSKARGEIARDGDGDVGDVGGAGPAMSQSSSTPNMHGGAADLKDECAVISKNEDESAVISKNEDEKEKLDDGEKEKEEKEEKEKEKGTGELYIKSTGVVAEGGDFDAQRAGAGREADRLLGRDGGVEDEGGERKSMGNSNSNGSVGVGEGVEENGVEGVGGGVGVGGGWAGAASKKEGKFTHLKEKIREKLHKH